MSQTTESSDLTPQSLRNPWEDSDEKLIATLARLPLAEQISTMAAWMRDLSAQATRDRVHRDTLHGETLAALRGEFERHATFEAEARERLANLSAALLTVANGVGECHQAVNNLADKIAQDRVQADADKAAILREFGARAKMDSVHDEKIAAVEKQEAAHESRMTKVIRLVSWRSTLTALAWMVGGALIPILSRWLAGR